MKILVTGSEGSLAQIVIPKLLEDGHEIIGCDNFARYGVIERERTYAFAQCDLTDSAAVKALFQAHSPEVIMHFAALIYGVVGFHKRPADIIIDNNLMTGNLLKHMPEGMKRIIYLSSSMVYEKSMKWPHEEPDTETTPVMSTSYGMSKYVSERFVQSYNEQYGTEYTIWRPFSIITPFETPEEEGFSHVFTDLIEKIVVKKQNPLSIFGDGEQIRCFTNIYDVADAIARFSLDGRAKDEVFNIGNPEPVTIKELARKIVEIAKKYDLLPADHTLAFSPQPIYDDDVKKRIPGVDKMKDLFDWKATIKIDESLEAYIKNKFNVG